MPDILGFSQICFSTDNINCLEQLFLNYGYTEKFSAIGSANFSEKKIFLKQFSVLHDVVFYFSNEFPALERVVQGKSEKPECFFYSLFFPVDQKTIISKGNKFDGFEFRYLDSGYLAVNFSDKGNNDFVTVAQHLFLQKAFIAFPVSDLKKAVCFWVEGMNFSVLEVDEEKAFITLKSFCSAWSINIVLYKEIKNSICPPFLDDCGFNCLSFFTRNIKAELKSLRNCGVVQCGDIFNVCVNEQLFKAVFLRGPSNELIELLERR